MNRSHCIEVDGTPAARRGVTTRPFLVSARDEQEFIQAMESYKKCSGRMFPTWSEIFEVLQSLGYEKRIWKPVAMPSATLPVETYFEPTSEAPVLLWYAQVETSSIS